MCPKTLLQSRHEGRSSEVKDGLLSGESDKKQGTIATGDLDWRREAQSLRALEGRDPQADVRRSQALTPSTTTAIISMARMTVLASASWNRDRL